MMRRSDRELLPRNGSKLIVGIVARISGCASQKELSLVDQVDHNKEEVAELYCGPIEYRVIATKGKGERLDRPELAEIEQMIRSRELDLFLMEDVGRLVRGTAAVTLWESPWITAFDALRRMIVSIRRTRPGKKS